MTRRELTFEEFLLILSPGREIKLTEWQRDLIRRFERGGRLQILKYPERRIR